MKEVGKEAVNTYPSTKTVTKKENHYNKEGELTGYSEREETIPITLIDYRIDFKCKHCGCESFRNSTVEELN